MAGMMKKYGMMDKAMPKGMGGKKKMKRGKSAKCMKK